MKPPDNLKLAPYALIPAELPGCAAFWAVYERLDTGAVIHSRYLGLLPMVPGETTDEVMTRAAERFGGA